MNESPESPDRRPPKDDKPRTLDESLELAFEHPNMPLTLEQFAMLLQPYYPEILTSIESSPVFAMKVKALANSLLTAAIVEDKTFERLPIDPSLY